MKNSANKLVTLTARCYGRPGTPISGRAVDLYDNSVSKGSAVNEFGQARL